MVDSLPVIPVLEGLVCGHCACAYEIRRITVTSETRVKMWGEGEGLSEKLNAYR